MGRDLYVTNISFDSLEEEIRTMFSVVGTVKSIRLLNDPRSGRFSGRAFVQMANASEARETIRTLDGALLGNRIIEVREAQPKGGKERPAGDGRVPQGEGRGALGKKSRHRRYHSGRS